MSLKVKVIKVDQLEGFLKHKLQGEQPWVPKSRPGIYISMEVPGHTPAIFENQWDNIKR